MARFRTKDRVLETSVTTGTGAYTLAGAATGFQTFRGGDVAANDLVPYFAEDGTNWEAGIGTVLSGPDRLDRTTVLKSSNANAAVDWGAGTKNLRCGWPAELNTPRVKSVSIAGGAGAQVLTQDEQRCDVLILTGALTGARSIEVDTAPWAWAAVVNSTTGGYRVTLLVNGATGRDVPPGSALAYYNDGTDVFCGNGSAGSVLSPAQITANQNDYAPAGHAAANVLRLTTDGTLRNLTGLSGGTDQRVVWLDYVSGSGLTLKDDDAASTATNRFDLAGDLALAAPALVQLKYDLATARWRVLGQVGSAASQAEQETGSSTSVFVTPGRQQYHPSAAKAWLKMTTAGGTPALSRGYNISSITDNGAGDFTANFTTAFSDANYCGIGISDTQVNSGNSVRDIQVVSISTSAFRFWTANAGSAEDNNEYTALAFFGDQ